MKSQLIEKQGKYYKECDVVMLPTTVSGPNYTEGYIVKQHTLHPNFGNTDLTNKIDNLTLSVNHFKGVLDYHTPQHLYFLSDEEIKEGDWQINHLTNKISQRTNKFTEVSETNCSKIIATTDSSLRILPEKPNMSSYITFSVGNALPQPSPEFIQAFIEAYNSGKPITKVLVEVYTTHETDGARFLNYKLKDNQIIIKKIEERMYSESEVIAFACWYSGMKKESVIKALERYHKETSQ